MVTLRRDNNDDAEDNIPLVRSTNGATMTTVEPKKTLHNRHRIVIAFVLATLAGLLLMMASQQNTTLDAQDETTKHAPGVCKALCQVRQQQRHEQWGGGDLWDVQHLLQTAIVARDEQISRLQVDYGEQYYTDIFQVTKTKSRAKDAFVSANQTTDISTKRFQRKLMIKVLTVQTAMQLEERIMNGCDCITSLQEPTSGRGRRRYLSGGINVSSLVENLPPLSNSYAKMSWTTGGHSAAAGHGNLYNESYTAFLQRGVKDVFAAVGIDFEATNFAMGGMSSGPEIGLCSEAIFGTNTDVISWDFGMTDGHSYWKTLLYANRAGLNPSRPAVIGINTEGGHSGEGGDSDVRPSQEPYRSVEDQGLTTLLLQPSAILAMRDAIPDMLGMTGAQMNATPEFVRYFKCHDQMEKGEPYCGDEKYTSTICNDRLYKASWHPGWRMTAMYGNLMALYLSEMLVEAIEELQELLASTNATDLLSVLKADEDADYDHFVQSSPPDDVAPLDETDLPTDLNSSLFYRSPIICHTAMLPAQTRYLGILTESNLVGRHGYDVGTTRRQADNLPEGTNVSLMPLVYDEQFRQDCPVDLQMDYKDYFYTMQNYSWTSLTIPNDAETKAYGRDSWKPKGVVVVCLVPCDWGVCETGDLRQDAFHEGILKFEMNGSPVTNLTSLSGCFMLYGEHGHLWPANKNGQYELRTKINGKGYLRISSLILL